MDSLPLKKATGGLTRRQAEVFAKLQQGKPNKVIAYELGMSESTVKVHLRSLMRTIGATNRTQAVFMGQQRFGSNRASQSYL
jgi:DNA-binding NarL/FixJ family response regulator